ncbi:multidrug MFS transporter [Frondihabitans sp. PAMC 28766]|uniref:epoxide hydrolase family protein n=1 Tax=Frondihabitans sp. PAMC 28766 TaxID=1795630 RepID=UPI00078B1F42|nr:epoxide hydrolase family protein [Frondihabitans sp. PAMC 28766]AMM21327.1 multidrug MFS transporter [Frondihabitans sp. PAMC 28766]
MTDASAVQPFDETASDEALDDLRRRLVATRWPDDPADAGWSLGTDVDYLRDLVAYWADGFDWRAQEATLSRLPRFRSTVDGLSIHFVHARAVAGSDRAVPLLLNHGWPDSFWRFTKVIDLLTDPAAHGGDPADAFDVVVPDMPGYGYSETPAGAALDSKAVAALWAALMSRLGYESFVTAGGDIGSGVSRYLALDFPSQVRAVHRTDAGVPAPDQDTSLLTAPERRWLDESAHWTATEGAYNAMHRTKPQTAAFGLTDSPVGLAAWIIEKLRSWSERGLDAYARDEILTLVTMYWLTGTIGSSMRMYNANAAIPAAEQKRFVEVPSGFTVFPGEITHPPREWMERVANTVRVTEAPRGGHFAAFEEPEVYVDELREFFRPFRG